MPDFFQQAFEYLKEIFPLLGVLFVVSLSAGKMSDFFKKMHLPGITGVLLTGILIGPFVLKIIDIDSLSEIEFLTDVALSFIAFAAGTELYIPEIKPNIKSITLQTVFQSILTFSITAYGMLMLADYIPFMKELNYNTRLAISLVSATIFVARSPSSAIAIISEMRAKGPFVKTALGVTVVIDVLVIILFAITLSIASNLIKGVAFDLNSILDVLLEIVSALTLGYILGKILAFLFKINIPKIFKGLTLLIIGYGVYILSHFIKHHSPHYLPFEVHIEPMLISIIASFMVTNYSKQRVQFGELIHKMGPAVYVVFFLLTGASIKLNLLGEVWYLALILFFIRLLSMAIGGIFGSLAAKEPRNFTLLSWMPYVTQAGIGIGLATVIQTEFPEWGSQFYTLMIGVIVLNQIFGPPFFKFAIKKVGESHLKHSTPEHHGTRDALIFGYEPQSISLSKQLKSHNWDSRIVCVGNDARQQVPESATNIEFLEEFNIENLKALDCDKIEAVVLMLSDDENYKLAELIYEHVGTKEVIVRLNKRENFDKFHELGALVVNPETALVGLLDSFVRSPNATSLLLGTEEDGNISMDIEITDNSIHGQQIKFLRLPDDVIIISVKRKGQLIVSHGYTRLKVGDVISVIGSQQSLEDVMLLVSV